MSGDDIAFCTRWIHTVVANNHPVGVAAASDDPDDPGVPRSMWKESPDAEGWVEWTPLPSGLRSAEADHFERSVLKNRYPPLFRAFLQSCHVMPLSVGAVELPSLPPTNTLLDLERLASSMPWLLRHGLLPFGHDVEGRGPACFDASNRKRDGDCPIVVVDLGTILGVAMDDAHRSQIDRLLIPVASSFRELLQAQP